jgi:hypothetical protein
MLPFFEHTDSEFTKVEVLLQKEFQHTIVRYRKDGIVHVIYKSGCTISVEDCYAMAKFISQIDGNRKYLMLTEPQRGSNIDEEARTLLASEKGNRFTYKNAILCSSIIHEMIGNFFIRMDNPVVPTKLFNSRDRALDWLKYENGKKKVS